MSIQYYRSSQSVSQQYQTFFDGKLSVIDCIMLVKPKVNSSLILNDTVNLDDLSLEQKLSPNKKKLSNQFLYCLTNYIKLYRPTYLITERESFNSFALS